MRYLDLDAATDRSLSPRSRVAGPKRKIPAWLKIVLVTAVVGVATYGLYILAWPVVGEIFKAPAAVLSFLKPPEETLNSTDGRTNILLLGVDYRKDKPSENLSDTMMVMSVNLQSPKKDVVIISVPRDTWVNLPQWTYSKGTFYAQGAKINAANAYGDAYAYPDGKGLGLAKKEMESVLGIKIHYVVRINFYGFKQVVDEVSGVTVNVETPFTDCNYPAEGQENNPLLSQRYICVSFKKGPQFMNGEVALEFARSRHGTNGEGSDLKRAKRQQKLIVAIRDKALTLETLADPLKVKSLLDSLGSNVQTNGVDLSQIGAFYKLEQEVNLDSAQNIVLTDDTSNQAGLLQVGDSNRYGGAFVFIPRAGAGDFGDIQAYIAQVLATASSHEATSSAMPSGQ